MILKVELTAWKPLPISLCLALPASGHTIARDPETPATVVLIRETSEFPDYKDLAPESPARPMWWWTETEPLHLGGFATEKQIPISNSKAL